MRQSTTHPSPSIAPTAPRPDARANGAAPSADGGAPDWPARIAELARAHGFDAVGVTEATVPASHIARLRAWLAKGSHGDMRWMADRLALREDPSALHPGARSVISLRMNYWPPGPVDPPTTGAAAATGEDPTRGAAPALDVLDRPGLAYVSRYALGRDYHKVLRARLKAFAEALSRELGPFGYRVFTDSAPILEKALAEQAGIGWIGKHTNLLARDAGSWFFIGEVLTDLPVTALGGAHAGPPADHCGRCTACLDVCPTQAFRGPRDLDARRCISYLTIEHEGPIPTALRPLIGNRLYGCDDCQLVCPWNRFARLAVEPDFRARHGLDAPGLIRLLDWREADFLAATAGMAIRRIGYARWQRNLLVVAGNALAARRPARSAVAASKPPSSDPDATSHTAPTAAALDPADARALRQRLVTLRERLPAWLAEHADWALAQARDGQT